MSTFEPSPLPAADRRVKVTHLVFGLLFLGLAGIWVLAETEVITTDRLPVLAPAVLIVAGVVGLVASLANSRNRRSYAATPGPASGPAHTTDDTTPTEEIR